MNSKSLLIYPVENYSISSIRNVNSYDSMQAFFIERNVKSNVNIDTVCLPLWRPKRQKHKISWQIFKKALTNKGLDLRNYKNIVFTKLGPERQFDKDIIHNILKNITGNIYKFEDTNIRLYDIERFFTLGHFITYPKNIHRYKNLGLSVSTDIFRPRQNFDKNFYVHVDHNYPKVANYFLDIKNFLYRLESEITKHTHWQRLKIIYHTKESSIKDLGHYDTTDIDINFLANLYGRSYLGLISHRESMGQYPIEMLSCGANIISFNEEDLPKQVKDQLTIINYNDLDYKKLLDLELLKQNIKDNRKNSIKFDYSNFTNRLIEILTL